MARDANAPARIWYQSFVDPEEQAPYFDRLRARLTRLAAAGITVDVFGIAPPDRFFHPLTEFRCADQAIRNALTAEREGYDAFVIGHFQEPGLTECRGAVGDLHARAEVTVPGRRRTAGCAPRTGRNPLRRAGR